MKWANLRLCFAGLLLLAGVAACSSSSSPSLDNLRTLPISPGKARLVVLYPAPIIASNGIAQIKWNGGQRACDLKSGSYVVQDMTPGDTVFSFSFCGMADVSRLKLTMKQGGKYYIRILPYDSSFRGILSGYPSEYAGGVAIAKGPFLIEALSESDALAAMQDLKAH